MTSIYNDNTIQLTISEALNDHFTLHEGSLTKQNIAEFTWGFPVVVVVFLILKKAEKSVCSLWPFYGDGRCVEPSNFFFFFKDPKQTNANI